MADCWVTAHVIDSPLVASGNQRYVDVPAATLAEIEPLGVAAVLLTQAPDASGYDSAHQTMVMLEFDPRQLPASEQLLVRKRASQAIETLQGHGVAPSGVPASVVAEFGDPLVKTLREEGNSL